MRDTCAPSNLHPCGSRPRLKLAALPLADWTGLPAPLLRTAGLLLVPYAAVLGWLAARPALSSATVKTLVAINAAWVVASAALLLANLPISAFGWAFVIAQALVVGLIAELQWTGLRRAERSLSPT